MISVARTPVWNHPTGLKEDPALPASRPVTGAVPLADLPSPALPPSCPLQCMCTPPSDAGLAFVLWGLLLRVMAGQMRVRSSGERGGLHCAPASAPGTPTLLSCCGLRKCCSTDRSLALGWHIPYALVL